MSGHWHGRRVCKPASYVVNIICFADAAAAALASLAQHGFVYNEDCFGQPNIVLKSKQNKEINSISFCILSIHRWHWRYFVCIGVGMKIKMKILNVAHLENFSQDEIFFLYMKQKINKWKLMFSAYIWILFMILKGREIAFIGSIEFFASHWFSIFLNCKLQALCTLE